MSDKTQHRARRQLAFLEGSWVNHGHIAAGPLGPGGAISGSTTYRWDIGNVWLTYKSQLELSGLGKYEVSGGVA